MTALYMSFGCFFPLWSPLMFLDLYRCWWAMRSLSNRISTYFTRHIFLHPFFHSYTCSPKTCLHPAFLLVPLLPFTYPAFSTPFIIYPSPGSVFHSTPETSACDTFFLIILTRLYCCSTYPLPPTRFTTCHDLYYRCSLCVLR